MEGKPEQYCSKEAEIAQIQTDLKLVKKAVMGNGKDGLIVTVPVLSQNVSELKDTVGELRTGLSGFLKYQQSEEGKDIAKREEKRRTRAIVSLMIGLITTLLASLIYTIHLLAQNPNI